MITTLVIERWYSDVGMWHFIHLPGSPRAGVSESLMRFCGFQWSKFPGKSPDLGGGFEKGQSMLQ